MELLRPAPETSLYQLRSLVVVARAARRGLAQPQRAMLGAIQQVVLQTAHEIEELEPISPAELASHVGDPREARQLVRFMVMSCLVDGPPSIEQMSLLEEFAVSLGVVEPAVNVIGHLAKGRLLRFRLAFARRSHVRTYLRNTRKMLGGVLPTIRALLIARGVLSEDVECAARYRRLAALPEDTLGHRFHEHCTKEGLPFSGEKGGFPIGALFHDFSHVLAGYDTSPEGEMKNAAFQAGFTRGDEDFFTALFAIVIHSAGINLTPFDMPVDLGRIGRGTLAADVLRAMQRGAMMNTDLGDDWDFWQCLEVPIDVVRAKLGIPDVSTVATEG